MAGKVKAKKAGRHQFYDLELLVSIIFLCVFGLVMIYSASSYKAQLDYGKSSYFVERQALFELLDSRMPIYLSNGAETIETTMEELLPMCEKMKGIE